MLTHTEGSFQIECRAGARAHRGAVLVALACGCASIRRYEVSLISTRVPTASTWPPTRHP
eukprot:8189048-Pyramimonas_sp.AAC.1